MLGPALAMEDAWFGVPQLEVLVFELGTVDGLATSAVVVGEVFSLRMKTAK